MFDKRRILVAQLLYKVGALLAFVSMYVSIAFIVLVQVYFAVLVDSQFLLRLRQVAQRPGEDQDNR